jgi:hypothetical protein
LQETGVNVKKMKMENLGKWRFGDLGMSEFENGNMLSQKSC